MSRADDRKTPLTVRQLIRGLLEEENVTDYPVYIEVAQGEEVYILPLNLVDEHGDVVVVGSLMDLGEEVDDATT